MGILFQVIATILLCSGCINMGLIYSWPSSTILIFQSENTTLNRPMENVEIALFTSLPALGSLVSHLFAGFVLDIVGRRYTTILTGLIFVISWSIIAISNRVEAILTAAFLSGTGFTMFKIVTIYVSEISQDSIRGTLTTGPNEFTCFGIFVSYFLGGALEYHAMVYTSLSFAVTAVIVAAVLKESPVTLMVKGREEEAAISLAFYRGVHSTSTEVLAELNNIRRMVYFRSEDAKSLTKVQEKKILESHTKKMSCWQHLKTTPSTRRQLFLVVVLETAFVCQGLPIVQVYAEPMFAEAVGDLVSPNLCTIILGLVVLAAGIVAASLIDVLGRRGLIIYSSVAAGICCVVLGTQLVTEWLPKWTVPLFMYIYATSHTFGAGTVPFVVGAEIFLPEVKSILLMLAVEWAWLCNFLALFLVAFGMSPVFYFFSLVCFGTAIYFYYFLPETKGLPVYAIQELFKKE